MRQGIFGLFLSVWFTALAAAADGPDTGSGTLLAALRAGGNNIYFRHAGTNWSQQDHVTAPGDWTSCDPERFRQLSDHGRADARTVGEAFRMLGVPVDRVLASPYCRTMETARLMELGPVEATDAVINMRVARYFGGQQAVVATARALLATAPPEGTNTVVVAHGNVARMATPVYPGEGEGVVFRPDGHGGFEFIGRLTPNQWRELAADASP
jgi:broad specificity phosphatase PhoE